MPVEGPPARPNPHRGKDPPAPHRRPTQQPFRQVPMPLRPPRRALCLLGNPKRYRERWITKVLKCKLPHEYTYLLPPPRTQGGPSSVQTKTVGLVYRKVE